MKNLFQSEPEILSVVNGFRDRSLSKEQWTHEAHQVTAIWFHLNHTPPEALCYLRAGIITYNEATGGKNTHTDGYHETLTLFWCRTIAGFVGENAGMSLVALCEKFLDSELAMKDYPLRFYTRDRLFSVEARAAWMEPDVKVPTNV